jgi:2,5-dichlorohydroquinone reductive dechlorinase
MLATVSELTGALEAALGRSTQIIGPDRKVSPRLELFHAPNSICSQKVRVVLAQHQLTYTSHTMNIFAGHTYFPDYVRLRLLGCGRSGLPLVAGHTGSTAASSGGCDPAVVPTLVDRQTDEVIIDSKQICLYIDALMPKSQRLCPLHFEKEIEAELAIVDALPNYQMLAGRPAGTDSRPEQLQRTNGVKFSMSKVKRCDDYMAEFSRDYVLVSAYRAKRAKELDAAANLFSEDAMRIAYAKATTACALLESKLQARHRSWLMGDSVSMADLFWAVELLRMKNLGTDHLWEHGNLPAVTRFVAAAELLPSIRSAVLTWPGALF